MPDGEVSIHAVGVNGAAVVSELTFLVTFIAFNAILAARSKQPFLGAHLRTFARVLAVAFVASLVGAAANLVAGGRDLGAVVVFVVLRTVTLAIILGFGLSWVPIYARLRGRQA
ncbi:MAG: hypothetical protein O3A10_16080 [Chloroflexi bacterium]|nr:hypothetical protein [Chloroflexota bacterium]MDA1145329.1 hypothetical protein [Chloroflexota bacterium]